MLNIKPLLNHHLPINVPAASSSSSSSSSANSVEFNSRTQSNSPTDHSGSSCSTTPRSSFQSHAKKMPPHHEQLEEPKLNPHHVNTFVNILCNTSHKNGNNKKECDNLCSSLSSSSSSTSSISCMSTNLTNMNNHHQKLNQPNLKFTTLIQKEHSNASSNDNSYRKLEDIITEADNLTLNSALRNEQKYSINSMGNKFNSTAESDDAKQRVKSILRKFNNPVSQIENEIPQKNIIVDNNNFFENSSRLRSSDSASFFDKSTNDKSNNENQEQRDGDLVDKSSCVLPSKLKSKSISANLNNSSTTIKPQYKPNTSHFIPKNVSYTSINSTYANNTNNTKNNNLSNSSNNNNNYNKYVASSRSLNTSVSTPTTTAGTFIKNFNSSNTQNATSSNGSVVKR